LLATLAGWVNQHQQNVIDYLHEENRVLREQLGRRRLRLTGHQRRRLAAKGKLLGRKILGEVATRLQGKLDRMCAAAVLGSPQLDFMRGIDMGRGARAAFALALLFTVILELTWGGSSEAMYLPMKIEMAQGSMPACTPVRVMPGHGEEPGQSRIYPLVGPWGEISVPAKTAEAALDRLQDCLAASHDFGQQIDEHVVSAFAEGALTLGMPLEFAISALGPPGRTKKDRQQRQYIWKKRDSSSTGRGNLTEIAAKFIRISLLSDAAEIVVSVSNKENRVNAISLMYPIDSLSGDRDQIEKEAVARSAFKAGMTAYRSGDVASALTAWKELAEDGFAPAQYSIADLYYRGEGVKQDVSQAVLWFKEAAEQYYPAAQYHLGFLYSAGEGVPRDLKLAYFWTELAARQGYQDAQIASEMIHEKLDKTQIAAAEQQLKEAEVTRPRAILLTDPSYPELARVARLEGTVTLQARIAKDGHVYDVEVLHSSRPNMGFERAAIDAISQWRYEPATAMGKAVDVYFTLNTDFSLH
jgi:TonB family protein